MTKEDQENIQISIADDGFFYTFDSYSDFVEVKDDAFHRRRRLFLDAAKSLRDYVDNPVITESTSEG